MCGGRRGDACEDEMMWDQRVLMKVILHKQH
jgi:hypothetical protein